MDMANHCPSEVLAEEQMMDYTTSDLYEYQREDHKSQYRMVLVKLGRTRSQYVVSCLSGVDVLTIRYVFEM